MNNTGVKLNFTIFIVYHHFPIEIAVEDRYPWFRTHPNSNMGRTPSYHPLVDGIRHDLGHLRIFEKSQDCPIVAG